MLDKFLDSAESRLYLIAACEGHGLVRVLLADTCHPASPAVLADGVGGCSEDTTDLAPPALPATLGALTDLSPFGLGSIYLGVHSGHCPPQTAVDRVVFPVMLYEIPLSYRKAFAHLNVYGHSSQNGFYSLDNRTVVRCTLFRPCRFDLTSEFDVLRLE